MNAVSLQTFQDTVWSYYDQHARQALPWRTPEPSGEFDPYKILVSELMLQQTQVARVIPKYRLFITQFPTVSGLAAAELGDVLRVWQGLGYNRRAKYLWQAAGNIHTAHADIFPDTVEELVKLPGVGINTAGAVVAYTWNAPVVYVETNIRTVYIHHFFADRQDITDTELRAVITASLPDDPLLTRDWYWALMDYGSYLKSTTGNLNKLSKSYTKQSVFKGSRREVRGQVLRVLAEHAATREILQVRITDQRLPGVLEDLLQEGLIRCTDGEYSL